jgi:DNA-binding CsgD family transcriptional regulator
MGSNPQWFSLAGPRRSSSETLQKVCQPGCLVCSLAVRYRLTPKEVELIACLCEGMRGRDLCRVLRIQQWTLRKYITLLNSKLGTGSRLEIALWAYKQGMVGRVPQQLTLFGETLR